MEDDLHPAPYLPGFDRQEHSDPLEGGLIALLDHAGVPDDAVHGMRAWLEAGGKEEVRDHDRADADEANLSLQAAWGDRAGQEVQRLNSFVAALPPDEQRLFRHARDSAGRLYANDSAFLARLAGVARARGDAAGGLNTIEAIEGYMRTSPDAYRKDEALQARLRELYDAREDART